MNSYTYTVYKSDNASLNALNGQGFEATSFSDDGSLVIVDKKDNIEHFIPDSPDKPSYAGESFPQWPYLSHAEAKQLVRMPEWKGTSKESDTIVEM